MADQYRLGIDVPAPAGATRPEGNADGGGKSGGPEAGGATSGAPAVRPRDVYDDVTSTEQAAGLGTTAPVPKPALAIPRPVRNALSPARAPAAPAPPLLAAVKAGRAAEVGERLRALGPAERGKLLQAVHEAGQLDTLLRLARGDHTSVWQDVSGALLAPAVAAAVTEHALKGWTSKAEQQAVLRIFEQLPQESLVETLSALAEQGRLGQLFDDLGSTRRQRLVGLMGERLQDPLFLAQVTTAIATQPGLDARLHLGQLLEATKDSPRAAVIAAAMVAAPAIRNDEMGEDRALRNMGRTALVEQLRAAHGLAAVRLCNGAGLMDTVIEVVRGAELGPRLAELAAADARAHIAGESDSAVMDAIGRAWAEDGTPERLRELALALPPPTLRYHLARLGAPAAETFAVNLERRDWADIKTRLGAVAELRALTSKPELLEAARLTHLSHPERDALVRFERDLDGMRGAIESSHGVRVHLGIDRGLWERAHVRNQVRQILRDIQTAADEAALDNRRFADEVELYLHDGVVLARAYDPWAKQVSHGELRTRLPQLKADLGKHGVELRGDPPADLVAQSADARRGALVLARYLDTYHNILQVQGVQVVRFGGSTEVREEKPSRAAQKQGAKGEKVLIVDASEILPLIGSPDPEKRAKGEKRLTRALTGAGGGPLLFADLGYKVAGEGTTGAQGSLVMQPFENRRLAVHTTYDPAGARVGVRHGMDFGKTQATIGAGVGVTGPFGEVDIGRVLHRSRRTEVIASAFAMSDTALPANVGAMLYGEHIVRSPDGVFDNTRMKAWASVQLLSMGPHVGVQWDFTDKRNDPSYWFVRADDHLGAAGGYSFDPSGTGRNPIEVAVGLGGFSLGRHRGWKLDVVLPFLMPWRAPFIYFTQFSPTARYHFSFDTLNGSAEVEEIFGSDPNGTSNIPPQALQHLFKRLMASGGIKIDSGKLRAHMSARGFLPHLAQMQELAQKHPDAEVRAHYQRDAKALQDRLAAEVLVEQYLRFYANRPTVSDKDVRRHYDENKATYAEVDSEVMVFATRAEALAAAEQLRADPGAFAAVQAAHLEALGEQRHEPTMTFRMSRPDIPPSIKEAAKKLAPGAVSDLIPLMGGEDEGGPFMIMRLAARREEPWDRLPAELKTPMRAMLQTRADYQEFSKIFDQYLGQNHDFVQAAVHLTRQQRLDALPAATESTPAYDWRSVRPLLVAETVADAKPVSEARQTVAERVQRTHVAVAAALASMEREAREPIQKLHGASRDDAERAIAKDIAADFDTWTGKLARAREQLAELAQAAAQARSLEQVRELEQRRMVVVHELQGTLDDLTMGESKLEELWYEYYERHAEVGVPVARAIERAKATPEVLALLPTDKAGKAAALSKQLDGAYRRPEVLLAGLPFNEEPRRRPSPTPGSGARRSVDPDFGAPLFVENAQGPQARPRPPSTSPEVPPDVAALLGPHLSDAIRDNAELVAELTRAVRANDSGASLRAALSLLPDEGFQALAEKVDLQTAMGFLEKMSPHEVSTAVLKMVVLLRRAADAPERLEKIMADAERLGGGYSESIKRIINDSVGMMRKLELEKYDGPIGSSGVGTRFLALTQRMDALSPGDGPVDGDIRFAGQSSLSVAEVMSVLKIVGEATKGEEKGGLLRRLRIPDVQASAGIIATVFSDVIQSPDRLTKVEMRSQRVAMLALETTGLNGMIEIGDVASTQLPLIYDAAGAITDTISGVATRFDGVALPKVGDNLRSAIDQAAWPDSFGRIVDQVGRLVDLTKEVGSTIEASQLLTTVPRKDNGDIDKEKLPEWLMQLPGAVETLIAANPNIRNLAGGIDLEQLVKDLRALPNERLDSRPMRALVDGVSGALGSLRDVRGVLDATTPIIGQLDALMAAIKPVMELDGTVREMTARFGILSGQQYDMKIDKRLTKEELPFLGDPWYVDVGLVAGGMQFDKNPNPGLVSSMLGFDVPIRLETLAIAGQVKTKVALTGATQVYNGMGAVKTQLTELHAILSGTTDDALRHGEKIEASLKNLLGLTDTEIKNLPGNLPEILREVKNLIKELDATMSTLEGRIQELEKNLAGLESAQAQLRQAREQFSLKVKNVVRIDTAESAAAYLKELYARVGRTSEKHGGSEAALKVGGINIAGTAPGKRYEIHLEGTGDNAQVVWTQEDRDVYREFFPLALYLQAQLAAGLETKSPTALQAELVKTMGDASEDSPVAMMLKLEQYFFNKRLVLGAVAGSSDVRKSWKPDQVGVTAGFDMGPIDIYFGLSTNPETLSSPQGARHVAGYGGLRWTVHH